MDALDADRLVLEATESKQILDAQFVDICSYWQLFSILDITRGRHKTPERILNVFRSLSLTENSPVGQHGSSSAPLLKAKASARSQALLNIKNIAMMHEKKPGFVDSPNARLLEHLAFQQFFKSDEEFKKALEEQEDDTPVATYSGDAADEATVDEPAVLTRTASAPIDTRDEPDMLARTCS